jgi:hypothetical protein
MSNKAVTQMIDPEYTVEFDGKQTYLMRNGVKLAMRRDDGWVSIEPGITVRDIVENGGHGIEVRMTVHYGFFSDPLIRPQRWGPFLLLTTRDGELPAAH